MTDGDREGAGTSPEPQAPVPTDAAATPAPAPAAPAAPTASAPPAEPTATAATAAVPAPTAGPSVEVPPAGARPVVRPIQPPAALGKRPAPRPARPSAIPWATFVLAALFIGAIALYYSEKGPQQLVYKLATISKFSGADSSTWYRLVAGLFVHGAHHELQAITVLFAVLYNGLRVERALGAGGMLLCFLAGGVIGDAVRVSNESAALLHESAGTTAGALALIGASASIYVRTREKSFLAAILGGMGSALVTTLFSGAAQQAAAFSHVLPQMLPAAGTSFLVGGLLGALVPLYDPAKRRGTRTALLAVTLVPLLAGLAGYASVLWPVLKPALQASPHARPDDAEGPELELHWDPRLERYEFGVPITHSIASSEKDVAGVILRPNLGFTPVVRLIAEDRDPRTSAELEALRIARTIEAQSAGAKLLEDGPIANCPLGPAYRYIMRVVREDQSSHDRHICMVQTKDNLIRVELYAQTDDLREAKALGDAIVRSLKVHSAPADKK